VSNSSNEARQIKMAVGYRVLTISQGEMRHFVDQDGRIVYEKAMPKDFASVLRLFRNVRKNR